MARRIEVEIIGDSRSLERAFDRSSRSAKDFNNTINRGAVKTQLGFDNVGRSALKFAGGYIAIESAARLATTAIVGSVVAASDLNEQINKSRVVFGRSSADIEAWAKTAADSFGTSRREALTAAATFGNLFAAIGISETQASEMSKTLVELAADLASFNNTSATDALDALRSGLIGEAEPLRRFGVLLSETRVQQEAMAATGKRSAKALTEQEKATARLKIILDDTATAQGDFARTSGSLANQTRTLKARIDDLSASAGNVAIPVLTDVVTILNDGTVAAGGFAGAIRDANNALKEVPVVGAAAERSGGFLRGQLIRMIPVIGQAKLATDLYKLSIGRFRDEASKPIKFDIPAINEAIAKLRELGAELTKAGQDMPAPFTVEQRRTFFDANLARDLDRVQDLASKKAQIARLDELAERVRAKMATTKDLTRRNNLEDELVAILRQQQSLREQIASQAQADREDAARAARERAERARQMREQRTATKMGWLEFAVERADATKTVKDDLKAFRALEAALKERIRQEGRTLDLVRELWRIRQRIRDLNKKQSDADPLAGLMQVSSKQLTNILAAGTGLGAGGRRVLGANIAGQQIHVYSTVELDGREVGRSVTTQQKRSSRRTAAQTSGAR